jgi:tetratricopeptide (TPR) repeat protein
MTRRVSVRLTAGPALFAIAMIAASVPMTAYVAAPLSAQPAQSVRELLDAGDAEYAARRPAAALPLYERALTAAPDDYGALWRTARALVDIAEFEPPSPKRAAQYTRATQLARKATSVNPRDAEGHFHLSRALGREALSVSARERVNYAVEIRSAAVASLAIAPKHPGALHVLGRWHAEIMRLNPITRAAARTLLGANVFKEANWKDAVRLLEEAVASEPNRTVHLLTLAQIYRDAGNKSAARTTYQRAIAAPLMDAGDERYKQEARRELAALGG